MRSSLTIGILVLLTATKLSLVGIGRLRLYISTGKKNMAVDALGHSLRLSVHLLDRPPGIFPKLVPALLFCLFWGFRHPLHMHTKNK